MIINADSFGMSNNFATAFTEAVNNMHNGDTLQFSNQTYHFYRDYCQSRYIHFTNTDSFKNPQKYFAMLFEGLEDITIDGNGATFAIHGDMCSLGIINCKNVTLKNFTIYYPEPSNTELKVVSNEDRTVLFEIPEQTHWYVSGKDVHFFEQSPFTKKNYWEFKNDENSHNLVRHHGDEVFRLPHFRGPFSMVHSVNRKADNLLEIEYTEKRSFPVGASYTFSQNKNRNTCGVFVTESSNVNAENLTINYLPGFGWLTQMGENVSFKKIRFVPAENHTVSAFADLIHVCGCKGDILVDDCEFCNAHDDAINVHGAFLKFKEKIDDHTAVFRFVHHQQGGYRAFFEGDEVQLYFRNTLKELGKPMKVVKAVDDIDNKLVTLTFDKKLPSGVMSRFLGHSNVVVENKTYCPNVEIMNSNFYAIPTRGILCTTSGMVKIHDNRFSNLGMAHIFISNDAAEWFESGPCRDVEIYNNAFHIQPTKQVEQLNCPGILIKPITMGRFVFNPIHKNIKIHTNYFMVQRNRAITAIGVDGISIYNNKIEGKRKMPSLRHCTRIRFIERKS